MATRPTPCRRTQAEPHPARRGRADLLCPAHTIGYGGVTKTKQPPANPGPFRQSAPLLQHEGFRTRFSPMAMACTLDAEHVRTIADDLHDLARALEHQRRRPLER